MWANASAELIKIYKRPANWLLLAVAALLGLLFTYVIPYAGYTSGTGGSRSGSSATRSPACRCSWARSW